MKAIKVIRTQLILIYCTYIEEKQLIQSDLRLMFKYIMQSQSTSIIKLLSTFLHEAFKLREQMVAT